MNERIQFPTYPTKTELDEIKAAAKEDRRTTSDFMVYAALEKARSHR